MATITPFLWFDRQAEEAARFYAETLPDGELGEITRYGEGGPGPVGAVMTVTFRAAGLEFIALNGGPLFRFTEAVSFVLRCATQAEVDGLWERLCEGGEEGRCGWLKDRFGLSWQVVPAGLEAALTGPDAAGAGRAMAAMLQMGKLDIAALRRAYAGEEPSGGS